MNAKRNTADNLTCPTLLLAAASAHAVVIRPGARFLHPIQAPATHACPRGRELSHITVN
ncbi:MAG: hypothetical protein HC774_04255 [Sphingomonadales bacterium]|nr:hypothetical protein [Sphingomonadales bacterium]